jgi:hypothetical protein
MTMPAVNGFQLTERDVEVFVSVYEHRFATIDHLIALTNRTHKRLHRRILKLVERKYLSRLVLPMRKHIYTLGRAAIPVLVERGTAPKDLMDARLRQQELKELFLNHAMMIVDVHTALTLATRRSNIKLVAWKEGQELFDSVTIREQGRAFRIPVRPDAFFTLEDSTRPPGKNRVHFMLEADRSTTTHERFLKKVKGYWHYFQQGLHTKKYGITTFRVATFTITDERALNLCAAVDSVLPVPARKFYLFTSRSRLSFNNPLSIFEEIFISPRDRAGKRYRMIQPSSGSLQVGKVALTESAPFLPPPLQTQ